MPGNGDCLAYLYTDPDSSAFSPHCYVSPFCAPYPTPSPQVRSPGLFYRVYCAFQPRFLTHMACHARHRFNIARLHRKCGVQSCMSQEHIPWRDVRARDFIGAHICLVHNLMYLGKEHCRPPHVITRSPSACIPCGMQGSMRMRSLPSRDSGSLYCNTGPTQPQFLARRKCGSDIGGQHTSRKSGYTQRHVSAEIQYHIRHARTDFTPIEIYMRRIVPIEIEYKPPPPYEVRTSDVTPIKNMQRCADVSGVQATCSMSPRTSLRYCVRHCGQAPSTL
eukprot:1292185-Amphidinium_carterae.1